jgi:hypothetical protein
MAVKRTLLVEGPDDEHVLKHICGNRGILHLDAVTPLGSVDSLLESVPVRLKASEDGDIVGVVIDADTDLAARWQSLTARLRRAGYVAVPGNPAVDGTIIEPPDGTLLPRVGIWVMPDNQTTGILEDFLRFLVPSGSALFGHVTASVAAIPEGERRFSQLAEPKALIHTWLAWQEDPGKPMGIAITARYLDPHVAQADALVSWLKRLFFP